MRAHPEELHVWYKGRHRVCSVCFLEAENSRELFLKGSPKPRPWAKILSSPSCHGATPLWRLTDMEGLGNCFHYSNPSILHCPQHSTLYMNFQTRCQQNCFKSDPLLLFYLLQQYSLITMLSHTQECCCLFCFSTLLKSSGNGVHQHKQLKWLKTKLSNAQSKSNWSDV